MRNKFYLIAIICGSGLAACKQEVKKTVAVAPVSNIPAVMAPFRFHKLIESAPGNDFDILSWGRGSVDKGAFIILHSDSAAVNYTTTTGDLDGAIVDAYNTDMDLDGNPEIIIQSRIKDTDKYVSIYAFEFSGSRANKLEFPRLTVSQRKGYRGNDNFYISEGKLMRQFPVYDGNNKDAKPGGQQRLLEYGLHNNSFTVKQVSKDSITTAAKPVAEEPVKEKAIKPVVEKKTSHKTKTRTGHKHHETIHKKKKKKHHHRSDD